ncbi:MAG: winged helix-turn-helix domain-containing protein [Alphaproteobacteria bacterium]|nr:winged helix-turn-helix domain-containing protein [Alphaproteobacteria bacterium]
MNDTVGVVAKLDLAAEGDFRLGDLLVRPSACRVINGHGETRIEPRVMEVLLVLWRAHGATVTREQLIEACWGGRAISDDAIARVIAKVRQLANGSGEPPHFLLETLPKVGYRLTDAAAAMPQAALPVGDGPAASITRTISPTPKHRTTWPFLFAGILALAAVVTVLVQPWKPRLPNANPNSEAVRLTQAARALIHERNRVSVAEAEHLLREAVAADPSYAPAWARLGHATFFPWWYAEQKEPGAKLRLKTEAIAYVKRALAISPNLAEAHAVMSMIQADTNEAFPWAERAVRLDPSNTEAWMWLGDARREQGDLRGALAAFEKARALDPAWYYTARPYIEMVFRLRGPAEAYRELDRVAAATNDQNWALQERADLEYEEGRLADSAELAAASLRTHPQNPFWARSRILAVAALLRDTNLQKHILAQDPMLGPNFNAGERPGWAYDRTRTAPDTWWDAALIGRQAAQLISEKRSATLLSLYDRRFRTPAEFVFKCPSFCDSIAAGPALVVALRQAGRRTDAARMLAQLSKRVLALEAAGDRLFSTGLSAARIAALEGNLAGAKRRLRDAVQRGWKGQDAGFPPPDTDPVYANLQDDTEFQSVVTLLRAAQAEEARKLARIDLHGI